MGQGRQTAGKKKAAFREGRGSRTDNVRLTFV